jgi:hypothetical protein
VWALKIANIVRDGFGEHRETDGSAMLHPAEEGFAPFKVSADYIRKHNPQVGGYYIAYTDGYRSYSPAEAFEAGYTRIEQSRNGLILRDLVNKATRNALDDENSSMTNSDPAFDYNVSVRLPGGDPQILSDVRVDYQDRLVILEVLD